ncbi:MAG: hypothetical protein PHI85_02210 [Victivallaceae bacterium]|nr:hypothetical protein [Victivallaceae bacterium]
MTMTLRSIKNILLSSALAAMASGCSSIVNAHQQKADFMSFYLAGDCPQAESELRGYIEARKNTGDEMMWQLEGGSFFFLTGNDRDGLAAFERAIQLAEEYDSRAVVSARDVGNEGAAALTNSNALPYRGMCRDRIFMNVFCGFCRLGAGDEDNYRADVNRMRLAMNGAETFFAGEIEAERKEAESAREKSSADLAAIKTDPDKSGQLFMADKKFNEALAPTREAALPAYGNFMNPLALFISGMTYWRDGDAENALVEFRRLHAAFPESALASRLFVTALKLADRNEEDEKLKDVKPFGFPVDRNVLYVIFANGLGANYKPFRFELVLPYVGYTGIAFPVCEYHPALFNGLRVNGVDTLPLASVDAIAAQEYTARLPGMITRLVVGYLVKEAAAIVANEAARQNGGDGAYIATVIGTSMYKYLFNTADTRCWEVLPKEFQLAILPMPETRRLNLELADASPYELVLPEECRSAIVYVSAPAAGCFSVRTLAFKDK